MLPQTCNAAFWSDLLARHVHQIRFIENLLDVRQNRFTLIASVFGSARPPFYRFTPPFFCGRTYTWPGPIRLVYEDHKRGDCKVHSDDFAERSCSDGTDFPSTALGIGRMFAWSKAPLTPHKRWMDGIQLRRCLRNSIANASIHITARGEKAGAETRDTSVS